MFLPLQNPLRSDSESLRKLRFAQVHLEAERDLALVTNASEKKAAKPSAHSLTCKFKSIVSDPKVDVSLCFAMLSVGEGFAVTEATFPAKIALRSQANDKRRSRQRFSDRRFSTQVNCHASQDRLAFMERKAKPCRPLSTPLFTSRIEVDSF